MRALLGLLILGSLFVMAASWQNRMTSDLRESRALRYGIPNDSVGGPDGWSRLVLGRPSGADPLRIPEDALPPAATPRGDGAAPWSEGSGTSATPVGPPASVNLRPTTPQPFKYVVVDGDSLGVICQKYYDVRPLVSVVSAVAEFNGLPSPDAIREGTTLELPDALVLFPELGE